MLEAPRSCLFVPGSKDWKSLAESEKAPQGLAEAECSHGLWPLPALILLWPVFA